MSARAIACMECEVGGARVDCIPNCTHISSQIDTQSSIEQDYLPSFLLGNYNDIHGVRGRCCHRNDTIRVF